jgi:hypothetical protein
VTIETLPEGTVAYIHTPVFIIRCVLCVCVCVCVFACMCVEGHSGLSLALASSLPGKGP